MARRHGSGVAVVDVGAVDARRHLIALRSRSCQPAMPSLDTTVPRVGSKRWAPNKTAVRAGAGVVTATDHTDQTQAMSRLPSMAAAAPAPSRSASCGLRHVGNFPTTCLTRVVAAVDGHALQRVRGAPWHPFCVNT